MAKKPERKQKLKVFRTPIGFHDAYVAAPSQKAALEAWGADGNLFAQGIAEQVTDPELMEEPLASPGKVIKRVRGSTDEHFAALDRTARKPKSKAQAEDKEDTEEAPKPKAKPKPRPRRDELDAAEQALEKVEKKQRKKLAELDQKIRELERKRRDLQRKHEAERDELAEERDRARSAYDRAMEAWRSAG
jgi:flagellar motility protein MotE (MotC chaperone)